MPLDYFCDLPNLSTSQVFCQGYHDPVLTVRNFPLIVFTTPPRSYKAFIYHLLILRFQEISTIFSIVVIFIMLSRKPSALFVIAVLVLGVLPQGGFAKPEQIRSDQDPVFHYYLQGHPKNGECRV